MLCTILIRELKTEFIVRYLMAVGLLLLLTFSSCAQHGGTTITPTLASTSENQAELAFAEARNKMVEEQIRVRDITDPRVISAMANVPRHRFVPPEYLNEAYADHPLPIGYGQTISQPYVVALMTQYLALQPGEKVLEIGTGSGYQAAILAELTDQVYTIEIIEPLGQRAIATLKGLDYNVNCKIADGYYGWQENAPFDAIIVTCAPDHLPQPLTRQLKDGGKMVIPVGPPGYYQTLWLIERKGEQFQSTNLGGVAFVPLVGEH
jgi:protein-L-isoaspartate(D-aspartate) O-methyltransferase